MAPLKSEVVDSSWAHQVGRGGRMTPSGPRWAMSLNGLLYTSMPFPLLIAAQWGITSEWGSVTFRQFWTVGGGRGAAIGRW